MKLSLCLLRTFAFLLIGAGIAATTAVAQTDSVVGQITAGTGNTFARDISGDGRFVVFESTGDLATQGRLDTLGSGSQPATVGRNNLDGNIELFLFDYAQRRIFQITNTKRALKTVTGSSTANNNIQVDVANTRPSISNDGRWIAFTSNAAATFTFGGATVSQTPQLFDGNLCTSATVTECNVTASNGTNANRPTLTRLQNDGNTEIWLYRIPDAVVNAAVNLSSGADLPLLEASAGTFSRVTNSPQSLRPVAGTDTQAPIIRDNNVFPSINDDGSAIAFVSDRDLLGSGANADLNREIFVFRRTGDDGTGAIRQTTQTADASFTQPAFSLNPTISGNGLRVAFLSSANLRTSGGGSNPDFNTEVFYIDLSADGSVPATPTYTQVTNTARSSPDQVINLFETGRRMSRDGRFIAYESFAPNPTGGGGTDSNGYGLFVFDAARNTTRLVGARTLSDPNVFGGDIRRTPTFTDYTNGTATTLLFVSRSNYLPNGTVSTAGADGLNLEPSRPVQIYSTPLNADAATPSVALTRLTRIPGNVSVCPQPFGANPCTEPLATNSRGRLVFNLSGGDLGGGNADISPEIFYLITPATVSTNNDNFAYLTGASARRVGTPSATPSPSPTPVTPDAVTGLSPGMLATLRLTAVTPSADGAAPEFAGLQRRFFFNQSSARRLDLPVELNGIRLSINNFAAGIYSVDRARREITFVVPPGLAAGTYDIVLNDNGTVTRSLANTGNNQLPIIAAQPDIFSFTLGQAGGGRARAFNVTNPVFQGEPFNVFTFRRRSFARVATVVRLYATGIAGAGASNLSIQIGSTTISGAQILTGAVATDQPGVYSVDFTLPSTLSGAGDSPITITVSTGAASRLADTAPRVQIL